MIERQFSIWRFLFDKFELYDCELTDSQVEPYRNSSYWRVQEDTGHDWPYEYKGKENVKEE